jgi:tetratricopeptide (TPR) repeat protein
VIGQNPDSLYVLQKNMEQIMPRSCLTCTIREPASGVFDHCARCRDKKQIYCSRICQKQDWKHHKAHCFTPAEATARKAIGKATTVRSCAVCKKSPATTSRALKSCSACRSVYYCGPVCQTHDWHDGGHSTACPGPRNKKKLPLNAAQHVCQEQVVLALRCANAGDKGGEARAYTTLGNTHTGLSQFAKATEYHTKALGIYRELGFRCGEGVSLQNLANCHPVLSVGKVSELYANSMAIARDIGDKHLLACGFFGLGKLQCAMGDCKQAIQLFYQSMAIAVEIGSRSMALPSFSGLGGAHSKLGNFSAAKGFFENALACALDVGDRREEMGAHCNIGATLVKLGQSAKAIELLHKALLIAAELGDRKGECIAYSNLALAHEKLGETDTAMGYNLKYRSMRQEIPHSLLL